MADNVQITAGSGTTVAADEPAAGAAAGAKVQRVKPMTGADGEATDVSTANPMPVSDAGGTLSVDDGGGSLTIDGTVGVSGEPTVKKIAEALPAGTNSIGQVDPRGNVAHAAADSGNPVKTGARARTALPTAVSQDNRTDNISDKFGRQLVTVAPADQRVCETLNRTATEAGQLFAALTEGAYVVTAIQVTNASSSVSTKVEILDGETVKWKGYAVKEGGGFAVSDPNGIFVGSKNTALKAKCATTGSDVDISVSAYKIPA